jgi:hypothetical protein
VAQLVTGERPGRDLTPYSPDRFRSLTTKVLARG